MAVKPKFYIITFANCEPWVPEPYDTTEERDAEARSIFNGPDFVKGEDTIGYMDIDAEGRPGMGTYTDDDLADDEHTPPEGWTRSRRKHTQNNQQESSHDLGISQRRRHGRVHERNRHRNGPGEGDGQ